MGWDSAWKLPRRAFALAEVRRAAQEVATSYAGVSVEVEQEDADTITAFFAVPWDEEPDAGMATVELSVYDMDRDGVLLSLEADAADNDEAWDDACELAESLAAALEGEEVEL